MKRPTVNITPLERTARVIVGSVGLGFAAALLVSQHSTIALVLTLILMLAALDLLVTGAVGHCPLYRWLGDVPRSLRKGV